MNTSQNQSNQKLPSSLSPQAERREETLGGDSDRCASTSGQVMTPNAGVPSGDENTCTNCNIKFQTNAILKMHMDKGKCNVGTYQCCGFNLVDEAELEHHSSTHLYTDCHFCRFKDNSPDAVKRHIIKTHNSSCWSCMIEFPNYQEKSKHTCVVNAMNLKQVAQLQTKSRKTPQKKESYPCSNSCGFKSPRKMSGAEWIEHYKQCTAPELQCQICKVFKTKNREKLRFHEVDCKHLCLRCARQYETVEEMKNCNHGKPVTCSCGKEYPNKHIMKQCDDPFHRNVDEESDDDFPTQTQQAIVAHQLAFTAQQSVPSVSPVVEHRQRPVVPPRPRAVPAAPPVPAPIIINHQPVLRQARPEAQPAPAVPILPPPLQPLLEDEEVESDDEIEDNNGYRDEYGVNYDDVQGYLAHRQTVIEREEENVIDDNATIVEPTPNNAHRTEEVFEREHFGYAMEFNHPNPNMHEFGLITECASVAMTSLTIMKIPVIIKYIHKIALNFEVLTRYMSMFSYMERMAKTIRNLVGLVFIFKLYSFIKSAWGLYRLISQLRNLDRPELCLKRLMAVINNPHRVFWFPTGRRIADPAFDQRHDAHSARDLQQSQQVVEYAVVSYSRGGRVGLSPVSSPQWQFTKLLVSETLAAQMTGAKLHGRVPREMALVRFEQYASSVAFINIDMTVNEVIYNNTVRLAYGRYLSLIEERDLQLGFLPSQ